MPIAQKTPKLVPPPTKLEIAAQNTAINYFLSPTMSQTLDNLTAIDEVAARIEVDVAFG